VRKPPIDDNKWFATAKELFSCIVSTERCVLESNFINICARNDRSKHYGVRISAENCRSQTDMRKAMKQGGGERGHQEARRRDLEVRFLMPEGSPP